MTAVTRRRLIRLRNNCGPLIAAIGGGLLALAVFNLRGGLL